MKNIALILWFCLYLVTGYAQQTSLPNNTCEHPIQFCVETGSVSNSFPFDYRIPGTSTCSVTTPMTLWYSFQVTATTGGSNVTLNISYTGTGVTFKGYTLFGPFVAPMSACDLEGMGASVILNSSGSFASSYAMPGVNVGYYYLKVAVSDCNGSIGLTNPSGTIYSCPVTNSCENCIGSFAPEASTVSVTKEYVLSAWVKEENAAATKTSYTYPTVSIQFAPSGSAGPFSPSGQIIDGWQRIEQKITMPVGATQMTIQLACSTGTCFFDDIRVFPTDGSMKTYVYDPVTLRLVAEMDERHYATKYEYDEEGKLVRVKKETEKGIMTIQENKAAVVKQ